MQTSAILSGVTSAFAALILSGVTDLSADAADRVGVAAAVTPQATSKPPVITRLPGLTDHVP
jgi:hypothetical protein